jgi:hypothetical protein
MLGSQRHPPEPFDLDGPTEVALSGGGCHRPGEDAYSIPRQFRPGGVFSEPIMQCLDLDRVSGSIQEDPCGVLRVLLELNP